MIPCTDVCWQQLETDICGNSLLNTSQKQRAITTLLNLQLHGFSENQIIELTGLVNNWNARLGIDGLNHNNGSNDGYRKKLDRQAMRNGESELKLVDILGGFAESEINK